MIYYDLGQSVFQCQNIIQEKKIQDYDPIKTILWNKISLKIPNIGF